jgi:hypothetical protein
MKKLFLTGVILIMFLLFSVATASAMTIGFDPSSQSPDVGQTAVVDLVISGLGDYAPDSISTFDLDVGFDSAILGFDSVVFGDPLLGDQLDLFGIGSLTLYYDNGAGSVNLFELSFDDPSDLDNLQAGSFTLATLTFDTLAVGFSALEITINTLGDSGGDPLSADLESGSISPVPAPATILLLASGLTALGVFGRKRNKK